MNKTPRILLVDDVKENLLVLEAILDADEADLLPAGSGTEALELLLENEVALAIVDVQMPGMDGFELAELMRGSLRTRDVPIIFVTAGPQDRRNVFNGYEAGAVDFLHKPLDPHVLRSKVGVFIQLWRQKRELSARLEELQRAQAALREVDRRKDEFMALLSHELRNPLMPIRNSLYILDRAEPGGPQARRAQEVIGRQVDHLARLVDDLLDVTRISRGKIQLRPERVDLREIVARTVDDHRGAFEAAGVGLEASLPREPLWGRGDPARIVQLVGNLLGNAVKFTPPGEQVMLGLGVEGSEAVLRVRDTGVGMTPDLLDRIFEPFTQSDRQLDRSPGGLGLGLVLVRGMAELHGGSAEATSAGPGQGSEFVVRLPLPEAAPSELEAAETAAAPTPGRRVLVIEDSPDTAESLRDALEFMGHAVAVAHDGPAGLEAATGFRPEVVLCDVGLPGMDGYEVARRFRASPDLGEPVLVAVTGYALPDDRKRAADAGFTHHVAKPPSLDDLEQLLAAL